MIRYLLLYLITFAGLVLAAIYPELSILALIATAALLFGTLVRWRRDERPFRDLGFPADPGWWKTLLLSTAAGIVTAVFITGFLAVTGLISIDWRFEPGALKPSLFFYTFIYTALIAASEEIIFRGVFFQLFSSRYRLAAAAVFSALLWAIFHLPAMSGDQVPVVGILLGLISFTASGIFLALLVGSSGLLWIPIGIHYGYNLGSSMLGAVFSAEITGIPFVTGSPGWVPETGAAGAAIFSTIAIILWFIRRN